MNRIVEPHLSSLGVKANVLCTLLFVFLLLFESNFFVGIWVLPLLVYLVEKDSLYVRHNMIQAAVLGFVSDVLVAVLEGVAGFFVSLTYLSSFSLGSLMDLGSEALELGDMMGMLEGLLYGFSLDRLVWLLPALLFSLAGAAIAIASVVYVILSAVKCWQYKEVKIPMIWSLSVWLDKKFHKGISTL